MAVIVANDEPRPSAIRVRIHAAGAVVVAFDGSPLPIEPVGRPAEGVTHPALYQFFMHLMVGTPRALMFGAILNALSERLVVSTMHDGHRYRAVFSRGAIVGLLARAACTRPDGTNGLVYRADPTVISGTPLSAVTPRAQPPHPRAVTATWIPIHAMHTSWTMKNEKRTPPTTFVCTTATWRVVWRTRAPRTVRASTSSV